MHLQPSEARQQTRTSPGCGFERHRRLTAAIHKHLPTQMYEAGADIVKIATMANDITDAAKMLQLLQNPVGERRLRI